MSFLAARTRDAGMEASYTAMLVFIFLKLYLIMPKCTYINKRRGPERKILRLLRSQALKSSKNSIVRF